LASCALMMGVETVLAALMISLMRGTPCVGVGVGVEIGVEVGVGAKAGGGAGARLG